MTTVAQCASLDEALLLRSVLASSGIEAFVPDEESVTYRGQLGSFRLQVNEEDAEEAIKVLGESKP
jgi:hypothetical protein